MPNLCVVVVDEMPLNSVWRDSAVPAAGVSVRPTGKGFSRFTAKDGFILGIKANPSLRCSLRFLHQAAGWLAGDDDDDDDKNGLVHPERFLASLYEYSCFKSGRTAVKLFSFWRTEEFIFRNLSCTRLLFTVSMSFQQLFLKEIFLTSLECVSCHRFIQWSHPYDNQCTSAIATLRYNLFIHK